MIYTPYTEKAMKIAYKAHEGQFDKAGVPYIFHPYHLAEQMTDEVSVCVALLHDVVEDSSITIEDLAGEFPAFIVSAVELLTHNNKVDYFEYIKGIKKNPIAVKVKLADLAHNSDLSRLPIIDDKAKERMQKYAKAKEILLMVDGQLSMF